LHPDTARINLAARGGERRICSQSTSPVNLGRILLAVHATFFKFFSAPARAGIIPSHLRVAVHDGPNDLFQIVIPAVDPIVEIFVGVLILIQEVVIAVELLIEIVEGLQPEEVLELYPKPMYIQYQ
jgi:hypothetical protein